tara:strand:+ start:1152 stop:2120 length:969 start_codon:yes stop_codon:yes gene_type:complete
MSKKFTQAYSITPHDSNEIDPRPDAYYVGSGNFTDDHDSWDTPKIHLRGGVGMTSLSGNMTAWAHADGDRSSLQPDSMGDISLVTGTAETNMVNYVHFTAATSFMQIDDHADFNIGTSDFEMMAVVRFEDNGNAYQHIAARDKGNNNWSWLRVSGAHADAGKIKFSLDGTDPKSDTAVPLDTWVILGVRRYNDDIMLYRNGVDDMSSAVTNAADLDDDDDDHFMIGCIHNGSDHVQSLQGDMAEFIFWEKSLSASDRATFVQRLQDRYFNPQRAKMITCTDPSDAGTYIIKYPQVGQIIHESPTIIRNSGTGASDIVGLKEQ